MKFINKSSIMFMFFVVFFASAFWGLHYVNEATPLASLLIYVFLVWPAIVLLLIILPSLLFLSAITTSVSDIYKAARQDLDGPGNNGNSNVWDKGIEVAIEEILEKYASEEDEEDGEYREFDESEDETARKLRRLRYENLPEDVKHEVIKDMLEEYRKIKASEKKPQKGGNRSRKGKKDHKDRKKIRKPPQKHS